MHPHKFGAEAFAIEEAWDLYTRELPVYLRDCAFALPLIVDFHPLQPGFGPFATE